eukprot:9178710-Alexandrium_andersonii.AAC.1
MLGGARRRARRDTLVLEGPVLAVLARGPTDATQEEIAVAIRWIELQTISATSDDPNGYAHQLLLKNTFTPLHARAQHFAV